MPLIEVLVELEFNGIKVDAAKLEELGQRFGQRMDELEGRRSTNWPADPFNIDSRAVGQGPVRGSQAAGRQEDQDRPSTDVERA
jgi:hypothetical protein